MPDAMRIGRLKPSPARREGTLIVASLLTALVPIGRPSVQAAQTNPEVALYDESPAHLWNRLHASLFVRTAPDGTTWGHDRLDPFMCRSVVGEPEKTALATLKEFLEKGGESLVPDPVKRAILQRDLWAAFDGAVWHQKEWHPSDELRKYLSELRPRLALAIRRLAPPAAEIAQLPDTYALAVDSKAYAEACDAARPERPFLPPDLLAPEGPWICLASESDPGPLAANHALIVGGRSSFLVLLRHPDGRQKGLELVKRVNERGKGAKDASSVHFPSVPPGAVFALVRRMALPNAAGEPTVTPITESVELRVHLGKVKTKERAIGDQYSFPQDVYRFALHRGRLFRNQAGGLTATGPDEKDVAFDLFNRRHTDFVEEKDGSDRPGAIRAGSVVTSAILKSCASCHAYPTWGGRAEEDWSMQSAWSITRFRQQGSPLPLAAVPLAREQERTLRWKKAQADWTALREAWK